MEGSTMRKRFKLVPEMEGKTALWYARQRGTAAQLVRFRRDAGQLTKGVPSGAKVLEVASGPGYLSIELARLGFQVTALDISNTFVAIAQDNARRAGLEFDVQQGDVARIPFDTDSFELIVCQAAFKNFSEPLRALNEMHRVLRPGGTAVIQDLSKDASASEIDREVRQMQLSPFNTFTTKFILGTMLRRRAYSPRDFERIVAQTNFGSCEITKDGIGFEVRLKKSAVEKAA